MLRLTINDYVSLTMALGSWDSRVGLASFSLSGK
jgi:hypothetical protein